MSWVWACQCRGAVVVGAHHELVVLIGGAWHFKPRPLALGLNASVCTNCVWCNQADNVDTQRSQAYLRFVEPCAPGVDRTSSSWGHPAVFFWWELGCLRYLHRNFDLSKVQLVGASAGGLIATLAACGVDEDKAVRNRWGLLAARALLCLLV